MVRVEVTWLGWKGFGTYSINCHIPLFSCANVVTVSAILVWYGCVRGPKARARIGDTEYERHPNWERSLNAYERIMLDMEQCLFWRRKKAGVRMRKGKEILGHL